MAKKAKKTKTKKQRPRNTGLQQKAEVLKTIWDVLDKLNAITTAASVNDIPLGALKCALGSLFCGLFLLEDFEKLKSDN